MELVFNTLTVDYQPLIDKYLSNTHEASCDYCLATVILFTEMKNLQVASDDIALYMKGLYHDEDIFFSPLCYNDEDFITAVNKISKYAFDNNIVLRFYATKQHVFSLLKNEGIPFEEAQKLISLQSFSTKRFCFENDRDSAEYIYSPDKLINLCGSVYKSKRNDIHHFMEKYKGRYNVRKYVDSDLKGVLSLVDEWSKSKEFNHNDEPEKLKFILKHRKKLKIEAIVLLIDDKIVASSIYSITSSNIGDEIFERCKPEYKGAYPFIAHFVATCLASCNYINFEEDLGIEGLRFSKLSYNPDFLIEKFLVCQNLDTEIKKIYQTVFGDCDKFTEEIFSEQSQCCKTALELDKGKVVSCAFTRDKKLNVFNKTVLFPFIYGLGTDENYRNRGLAKKNMYKMLNMLNDQNYGFCGLYPFPVSRSFYEKMGFINFNYSKKKKLKDFLLFGTTVKINENINAEEYTEFFNRCYERLPLYQHRDLCDTQKLIKEVLCYGGNFYEFWLNDKLYGYVIRSDEEIEESIFDMDFIKQNKGPKKFASTEFNSLLNEEVNLFLGGLYKTERQKLLPYDMIRPVNKFYFVKTFLPLIETNKNYNVNLFIKDDMTGNSTVNLVIKNKVAFAHANSDKNAPIIKLTAEELARWTFGITEIKGLPKIKINSLKTMFSDSY